MLRTLTALHTYILFTSIVLFLTLPFASNLEVALSRAIMSTGPPRALRSGFCCYILQSERWPTPYTGKTCDLARRLRRHNRPSKRSRAYTKGKGPWRVAVAVFGLRSNRQSVWLELALKRHARHRARPAGLSAVQSAVLDAVRVCSRPDLWWRGGASRCQMAPTLHVHVFKSALASWPVESALTLPVPAPQPQTVRLSCHRHRAFPA